MGGVWREDGERENDVIIISKNKRTLKMSVAGHWVYAGDRFK